MTDSDAGDGPVLIWITEGTWRAGVDAALRLVPPGAPVTLLHVTAADLPEAAHGAYLGLFGRGQPGRDPGRRVEQLAAVSAGELLDAAARRLGRPCQRMERRGAPEREVVTAAADASLLIMARDGDRSRLGPKSLGKAARFVVDHAPCPVLLVWPGAAPAVDTIPPPPHPPHRPHPAEPGQGRLAQTLAVVSYPVCLARPGPGPARRASSLRGSMIMSSASRRTTAVGIDRLQPGDHAFLEFSDDEERWEILSAFTRQGFTRDEKVFLLVDVGSTAEAAARVAGGTAQALRATEDGRLVVSAAPRFAPGEFDAKSLVAAAHRRIGEVVRAGFSGLRSASEMSLTLAPVERLDQAVEYEAALHQTLFGERASPRYTALCMWDERRFGGEPAMAAAHAVHPVTVLDRVGILLVTATPDGVRLTGDSDMSTRPEFAGALRALASRPEARLVLDIADLSFLDAYSVSAILRMAAGLGPPRRLVVRCRNGHRRMLHALGARSISQLSVVTERL